MPLVSKHFIIAPFPSEGQAGKTWGLLRKVLFFVFDKRWAEKYFYGVFFFQPFKWLKVSVRSLVTSFPELVRVGSRTVLLRAWRYFEEF
jgi:hypothetical protein